MFVLRSLLRLSNIYKSLRNVHNCFPLEWPAFLLIQACLKQFPYFDYCVMVLGTEAGSLSSSLPATKILNL